MIIKRNGGIWFWRLGRIGGSFYLARPKAEPNPYATGYRVIAAAFATMFAVWIAIGFNSGFIG